jgi:hypothetical protein
LADSPIFGIFLVYIKSARHPLKVIIIFMWWDRRITLQGSWMEGGGKCDGYSMLHINRMPEMEAHIVSDT